MAAVKAAVMTGPGAVELREFPRPAIGGAEILLKVERAGICGSTSTCTPATCRCSSR